MILTKGICLTVEEKAILNNFEYNDQAIVQTSAPCFRILGFPKQRECVVDAHTS